VYEFNQGLLDKNLQQWLETDPEIRIICDVDKMDCVKELLKKREFLTE